MRVFAHAKLFIKLAQVVLTCKMVGLHSSSAATIASFCSQVTQYMYFLDVYFQNLAPTKDHQLELIELLDTFCIRSFQTSLWEGNSTLKEGSNKYMHKVHHLQAKNRILLFYELMLKMEKGKQSKPREKGSINNYIVSLPPFQNQKKRKEKHKNSNNQ